MKVGGTGNDTVLNVFGDVSAPCNYLAKTDPALKTALDAIGSPVIRKRKGGFEGLFRIIVEQQVSVPSTQAIWARCREGAHPISARHIAQLGEESLKTMGLTRQKSHYIVTIAKAIGQREFSFGPLPSLDDEAALSHLQQLKGVGPWSAGIYLLFCEGRIDIWPPGDVALEHSFGRAKGLPSKPASETLNDASLKWRPYRGLAAHILWTYYAHIRGRKPI